MRWFLASSNHIKTLDPCQCSEEALTKFVWVTVEVLVDARSHAMVEIETSLIVYRLLAKCEVGPSRNRQEYVGIKLPLVVGQRTPLSPKVVPCSASVEHSRVSVPSSNILPLDGLPV